MAKWLDKYEQGGLVLKKKTKDNYGKRENANEGYSTAGPGWVGEGTTNKGFNYNGAWGGTMAMGGALPGAVGFTYARTQDPAPSNGPYAKKTLASAQSGKNIPTTAGKVYHAEVNDEPIFNDPLTKLHTLPTTADSTRLYNSQIALNKFYENEMKAGRITKDWVSNFYGNIDKDLRQANLDFYRTQIQRRANKLDAFDNEYKEIFNLSPEQVRQLEYKGLAQTKGSSEYQEYYRDLVTPLQNLMSPFALVDKRISPQRRINYLPKNSDYPGGNVTVYDYDPILIKPVNMLTPEERALRIKRYGKDSGIKETVSKPIQKIVSKPKPKPEPEPTPVVEQQPVTTPIQQPTPQPKQLYNYDDGEQLMAPIPNGWGFGTMGGGAVVGVKKKDGTIEYIKPEDYKRMGVPKYGQDYIKAKQKMQFGGPIKPDGVPIFRENSDFLNPYDDYDFYKPPLYDTPLYDKMINNYSDKQQVFSDKMWKNDSKSYSESSNTINLSSGRFRGAKVDPEMINDIVKAAKDNNVDPWLMLSLVGRESTFGSGTYDNRNRIKMGNKKHLVSGWNVDEDYTPYEVSRFLADNQVPGVKVANKDKFGWEYHISDKKAINDYLEKNPQLIDRYNKKLQSTPDIGELDSFALAAQRIKKKGIQNYNPGDPKYPSMINEDMNLLKNDAALKAYMKSKGYRDGGVIKDDRGQWAYPGEVTEIGSNDITMQGVDYPVLGVSDTGDTQMMYPDQDYKFDGEKVVEYPMMQEGGWLDKYQDGGNINKKLKEEAEERLARMNTPKATISQYTPEPGEQAKFDKQKLERIAEDNAPLNRMAASKGARNIQDAALFALDVMGAAEGVGAIKSALKSKAKNVITSKVTRGPINYWEEPGFAKRNPNFNPEAYANSPIGNVSASKDIPEGMTPYLTMDNVTPNVKPSWKSQELPGLHLSATMEGGPISKIIEPKTGLINVDQALTIIGKESGGASKVDMIKQVLGKDIPKKMDYNDFRKTVQDQLIPLEREVVDIERSAYGINNIGFTKSKGLFARKPQAILDNIEYTKNHILKLEKTGDPSFKKYIGNLKQDLDYHLKEYNNIPLENQTIRLSNKNKFGFGADTHGNPEETLGHIHFLRDAESPDVLTMTQLQSDAFQGTHRTMPKSLEEANAKLNKLKDYANYNPSVRTDAELSIEEAAVKNFSQKSLLDKNHQERYLQELVDYAGSRGDINKIRVPTSETAAKVQGYKPVTTSSKVFEEYNKLKGTPEYEQMIANTPDADKVRLEKVLKGDIKGDIYDLSNETILKKYSEQPKIIKKAFGIEPKTVIDSKGNSWYEFDIPAKFKGGKGEIKAFEDGGWLNKYK